MQKVTIHLGKGVILQAPIKLDMTVEEWVRMTTYINTLLASTQEVQLNEAVTITQK